MPSHNFGATAGQTIIGNLQRGADGRFAGAGKPSEQNFARGGKKPKGSKAKPKRPPLDEATVARVGGSLADARDIDALIQRGGTSPDIAKRLVDKGFARTDSEGRLILNSQGRSFANAVKRGDAAAAASAVSGARERRGREGERERKRAERESAREQRRGERERRTQERERARGERQQAVNERRARMEERRQQRLANRVEEIQESVGDGEITPAQMTRAENRLDEIAAQLDDLAISDERKRQVREAIAAARSALSSKPESLTVIKESGATPRWVTFSSNPYRDRDKEFVVYDSLQTAVKMADQRGEYGVLRIWHVGDVSFKGNDWTTAKAVDGFDLGDADFVMMLGRMMIHSGTFYDDRVAPVLARHAHKFKSSLGFAHPPNQPVNGEFRDVKVFEVSLVPTPLVANTYTGFGVFGAKK